MRRLILEAHARALVTIGPWCDHAESAEVLHFLRLDSTGLVGIFRICMKEGHPLDTAAAEKAGLCVRVLSSDGNQHVVYMEAKPRALGPLLKGNGAVHLLPIGWSGDQFRIALFGDEPWLSRAVARLRESNSDFRIVSVADARFAPSSPLAELTERQREVLLAAYKHGYYELPRRTNSERLAHALHLDKSTVAEHLRKAEERLMSTLIGTSPGAPSDHR